MDGAGPPRRCTRNRGGSGDGGGTRLASLLVFGSPLRLAVLVGLVLLSTAAAGVALGRDMADVPYGVRTVGPASHGILIMTRGPAGGRSTNSAWRPRHGVEVSPPILLQRGDDLRALAEQAVARGADVIGMAGGDGSQALVADVARQHDVAFVCIPAGTRNHFALDLGLDRTEVVAALDAYGTAVERRVDLALIGDRVFVNNASLGAYATVVQSDAYRGAMYPRTVGRGRSGHHHGGGGTGGRPAGGCSPRKPAGASSASAAIGRGRRRSSRSPPPSL
jgi:hypothetical protein